MFVSQASTARRITETMKRDLRMPELIPTDMCVSEFSLTFPY